MSTRRTNLLNLPQQHGRSRPPLAAFNQLIATAESLQRQGRIDDAIDAYRDFIAGGPPEFAHAARFNLGVLLGQAGRIDEAIAAYGDARAGHPEFLEPGINLGNLLELQGRHDEALAAWSAVADIDAAGDTHRRALQLQALNNMGRLMEACRRYPDAEEALRRSLALDPAQPDVIQHWVHLRQKQCAWPVYLPLPGLPVADMLAATSPLAMLAHSDDPGLQLMASRGFVQRKIRPPEGTLAGGRQYGHERLRIGYLSGDLCVHAVGLLLAEVIERHDRRRFDIVAFDYSRDDGTDYQTRLRAAFDRVHPIGGMTDAQAAELIAACEIDVLVDLHGLSSGTRPGILALRPAPVQATWLGFIGSSALPWIDYVIADDFSVSADMEPFFTEKVLRMATPFLPRDSRREQGGALSRAAVGLPDDAFVFASFNNAYKLNPDMFAAWMDILRQVPGSVLWLLDDNPTATGNLSRAAEAAGIDAARLVFAQRTGFADFVARLRVADLFLDNHPYNAGSTAQDALAAGLPMLTLSGRSFVSRMAGSLLVHAGLDELVTFSHADYVSTAVALAQDPARMDAIRGRLASRNADAGGPDAQARALEAVLLQAAGRAAAETPVASRAQIEQVVRTRRAALVAPPDDARFALHQIAYSADTLARVKPPFRVMNNLANPRPDWQEYWPIRQFLLNETLDEDRYYGFFSPRFAEKTGLDGERLQAFLRDTPHDIDVVTFSPQADMGAFFLNVFEQNDVFDPGFAGIAQSFIDHAGMDVRIDRLLMDSRHIVFSNYFVARPRFWREWLCVNEKLFALCESGPASELRDALLAPTNYRDDLQRKVFLSERIASLLLATQSWRVRSYSTFQCAWSATRLGDLKSEAVLSDALKIAMSVVDHPEYRAAYARLRDELVAGLSRGECRAAAGQH